MNATIRNAFVLGAGLGTRLNGLTARRPKPLIPICGKPLITFAFDHLLQNGVTNLVVNTHHQPEAYAKAFPDGHYNGTTIQFAHEEDLLETAGGIKNVEPLLGSEPFIVYNGDILCDIPIEKAIQRHQESGNEVTMVLRSEGGPLHIALDDKTGKVVDIAQRLRQTTPQQFLFTGVYIVQPEFFARIPAKTKISVIPIFFEMIKQGAKLGGVVLDEGHWWDLGTRGRYLDVHQQMRTDPPATFPTPQWIDPTAQIAPGARILGATVIGPNVKVGEEASLTDCIVWENGEIAPNSVLHRCVVTAGAKASGVHTNLDF